MPEYLVRASLEFIRDFEQESHGSKPAIPLKLPVNICPFRLEKSPNAGIYLADLGFVDPDQVSQDQPTWEYPISLLYLEFTIQDSGHAQAQADSRLEAIELLLRLFQPGGVSIRRHNLMWRVEEQGSRMALFLNPRPIKPEIATLYGRTPYPLGDDTLANFVEFFKQRWDVLDCVEPYLKTALARFNSSYERRDLSDRLIDLVVALEALFGDGEPGSIAYKVAMRCACWLHPPGDVRVKLFSKLKNYYSMRSKAVHGGEPISLFKEGVVELEEVVRRSLLKFLEQQKRLGGAPHGRKIDDLIMLGKI